MSSAFSDRIIQSLLDTDFYKLTMMQAVLHHYPNAEVEWAFRSRSGEDLSPYLSEIRHQIEALAELQMSAEELAFLERVPYMQPDFIRFLGLFRFDLRYLRVDVEDGELVMYLRGPWLHVILFEVPLLAIVSEVRNRYRYREVLLEQVWGYQHEGYEHTVNTHINRLRSKIERDPAEPDIILTVWGKGYKFAPVTQEAAP